MASERGTRPEIGNNVLPRILIAEDEPDNQTILSMIARTILGAEVDLASNGMEVMKAVQEHAYDLLVLDLMMPVMDGFDVARRLRQHPRTSTLPIVAISALARPGDREAALAAGCDEFIRKPFEIDELERTLRALLGRTLPAKSQQPNRPT